MKHSVSSWSFAVFVSLTSGILRRSLRIGCAVWLVWFILPDIARAASREARIKVRAGIQLLGEGNAKAAAEAFAEADVSLPDDPRIAFDRGCAAAAEGDADKAIEFLQKAALARDSGLAARAQYNLGCIAAEKARTVFGETPVEATPEQRKEGLSLLTRAVGHYRDCLKSNPSHAEARSNLETIRLWIKQMLALWSERDRKQTRDEMNLLQFLELLEQRQLELRGTAKNLAEEPDSPKRRQALAAVETAQRELAEEIEPLKEKIKAGLEPPPSAAPGAGAAAPAQGTPAPAAPNPESVKALEILNGLADEAHQGMTKAADRIGESEILKARESQLRVLDQLNEIFRAVAPFANLVQKALATQLQLVDQSTAIVEPENIAESDNDGSSGREAPREEQTSVDSATKDSATKKVDSMKGAAVEAKSASADEQHAVDFETVTLNQSRVAGWGEILPLKAQAELKNLEAGAAHVDQGDADQASTAEATPEKEHAQKQLEGLKTSLNKAIELGPQVHTLASEAAESLKQENIPQAFPKQQAALKLLQEIAESLPKQDPQQDQSQQDDKQKQDNQQDQKKEDQQQKTSDKQDQSQAKQDRQDQPESKGQPRDISREQAESVLRKVRERERKHRDREREYERMLSRPGKVDKDW